MPYNTRYNLIGDLTPTVQTLGYGRKPPLENKRLPVRVALAGRVSKGIRVVAERHHRNGWEPFAYLLALKPARAKYGNSDTFFGGQFSVFS